MCVGGGGACGACMCACVRNACKDTTQQVQRLLLMTALAHLLQSMVQHSCNTQDLVPDVVCHQGECLFLVHHLRLSCAAATMTASIYVRDQASRWLLYVRILKESWWAAMNEHMVKYSGNKY